MSQNNRLVFTKRAIESLPLPAKGRSNYRDVNVPSLALRVDANGRKSYFWFRKVNGVPTFRAIGTHPETSPEQARGEAHKLSAELEEAKRNNFQTNPFERNEAEPTLDGLLTSYLERHLRSHAKNPAKAEYQAKWMFKRYLASWRERKIGQIRKREVLGLMQHVGDKHGHYAANRMLQLLRAVYGFAISSEIWGGENPCSKVKLFHEDKRDRFLQPDELPRLFAALKKEPKGDMVDFVNLLLWTGARKADVMAMRWQDISLADNRWTIPNPKNRTPYLVPLTPEAVKILRDRQAVRVEGNGWVFPSFGKSGHLADGFKARWAELLKRAKIADFRQHDLRRTLGSWQAANGASLPVIGASLGHKSLAATQIYSRLNLDPVRASVMAATRAMLKAAKQKPKLLTASASA